jgi:hypothetical protein
MAGLIVEIRSPQFTTSSGGFITQKQCHDLCGITPWFIQCIVNRQKIVQNNRPPDDIVSKCNHELSMNPQRGRNFYARNGIA